MKPTNLKVGQKWIRQGTKEKFFVVLRDEGSGKFLTRWENGDHGVIAPDSIWQFDYRLDETYMVKGIMRKYETA